MGDTVELNEKPSFVKIPLTGPQTSSLLNELNNAQEDSQKIKPEDPCPEDEDCTVGGLTCEECSGIPQGRDECIIAYPKDGPIPKDQPLSNNERVTDPETQDSKIRIVFIINGENVPVEADTNSPLHVARDLALTKSHNVGRPLHEWEIRDEMGELLWGDMTVESHGIPVNTQLFLSLKVGAGGDGKRLMIEELRVIGMLKEAINDLAEIKTKQGFDVSLPCPICRALSNFNADDIGKSNADSKVTCKHCGIKSHPWSWTNFGKPLP